MIRGSCTCLDLAKGPWSAPKLRVDPACPVHGALDALASHFEVPRGWLQTPIVDTCICRVIDTAPGEVELAIHEDCPIHWREAPDE